jgi:hypothetical protein
MLRRSVLAFAALAALGTAALTPSVASADWDGWRHRDRFEDRLERRDRIEDRLERRLDRFEDRYESCVRVRHIWTPWGWTWRRLWICG